MPKKFRDGMRVRLVDPAKADVGIGTILEAYDYNGDMHVEFPGSEGTGYTGPRSLRSSKMKVPDGIWA